MDLVLLLAAAALGGGGLATLVTLWARRRNTGAEADKTDAEAAQIVGDTYGKMLTAVERRVDLLETENHTINAERAQCVADLAHSITVISEMRVLVADADANARVSRAAVVELQDRLDKLEHSQSDLVELLDVEILKRENGG